MHTLREHTTQVTFEDHLDLDDPLPLMRTSWAQGDVPVVRPDDMATPVTASEPVQVVGGEWVAVAGGHDHVVVGTFTHAAASNREGTAVAVVTVAHDGDAALLHAEHGGCQLATGVWVIVRQREQAAQQRLVAD